MCNFFGEWQIGLGDQTATEPDAEGGVFLSDCLLGLQPDTEPD